MTEITPLGTVNRAKPFVQDLDAEAALDVRCKQGRVPYGIDMKIVNEDGAELPRDGATFGRLCM